MSTVTTEKGTHRRAEKFAEQVCRDNYRRAAYVDQDGCLVFHSEETYARYVESTGKRPGEVNAIWVDEQGFRNRHGDFQLRPEVEKELDEIREEPHVPADDVWRELQAMGVRS